MHALIPLPTDASPIGALVPHEDLETARSYAEAEKAAASRRAYNSDWAIFTGWCGHRDLQPLPASPQAVAAFIAAEAQAGRTDIRGIRDRALIAFGFASAMRRSELVALRVEDLTETSEGYRVLIRRSKTDQEGQGQTIAIPRGYRLKPVEAVQRWLAAAEINSGPLFRRIDAQGRVTDAPLTAAVVALRVKRRAHLAGIDPANLSGHSLRSGFITSAARHGASIWKLADQSRHRSMDTLRGYVRDGQLFEDHAGEAFL